MLQAKKVRYHGKKKTKRKQKDDALRRNKINEKKEYLRKIGKLDEMTDQFGRLKIKIDN